MLSASVAFHHDKCFKLFALNYYYYFFFKYGILIHKRAVFMTVSVSKCFQFLCKWARILAGAAEFSAQNSCVSNAMYTDFVLNTNIKWTPGTPARGSPPNCDPNHKDGLMEWQKTYSDVACSASANTSLYLQAMSLYVTLVLLLSLLIM